MFGGSGDWPTRPQHSYVLQGEVGHHCAVRTGLNKVYFYVWLALHWFHPQTEAVLHSNILIIHFFKVLSNTLPLLIGTLTSERRNIFVYTEKWYKQQNIGSAKELVWVFLYSLWRNPNDLLANPISKMSFFFLPSFLHSPIHSLTQSTGQPKTTSLSTFYTSSIFSALGKTEMVRQVCILRNTVFIFQSAPCFHPYAHPPFSGLSHLNSDLLDFQATSLQSDD